MGPELDVFEARFAEYCGVKYAIGVGSGTSALLLTLRALGIGDGDEVITAPNSFVASASSIALAGARPIFADVREDFNLDPVQVESVITPRTKAIMPVHLTGRPADMESILEIATNNDLFVIEDCAQAVGAKYRGQRVGGFGVAGCFSLHPLKTLNAAGDAGVVVTDDLALYKTLRKARNHGLLNRDQCEFFSYNSRLDTIQAASLLVKMDYLKQWINERRARANFYVTTIGDLVQVPREMPHEYCVYHTFMIKTTQREALRRHLLTEGIQTAIHYPIPIHLQPASASYGYRLGDFPVCERQAGEILSLPVHSLASWGQMHHVSSSIRRFFEAKSDAR
jgi:dTDP-4-amino-4,6-dideoxygalactose transaminase